MSGRDASGAAFMWWAVGFACGVLPTLWLADTSMVPDARYEDARARACALALNHTAPTLSDSLRIAQDFPECEWWPAPDTEPEP